MRFVASLSVYFLAGTLVSFAENWPGWRGPRGDGTSAEMAIPTVWSPHSNIVWKTELPGSGHASPIIWENRLFTIAALPETGERILICLDATRGEVLWRKTVLQSPLEGKHSLNSYASSTPVTDGKFVYVTFLDRKDMVVAAYNFAGQMQWSVRPGEFESRHGFCSSPILFADEVIVNGDHDGDSYLVALRRTDGKILWKTPRQNRTRSYCVPLIREAAGKIQMVLSGDKCVASYDPSNGKLQWIIDGPTEQFVASLVYSDRTDLFYMTGGYPDHHILAIQPDGSGNVTKTHIRWRTNRGAAYVPSPIVEKDYFLVVSDSGVAHCFDAASGTLRWQQRLGEHHASLISAAGLVYFLNDDGIAHVVRPGPTYELISRNELGEKCFASPAISEGRMFLRGEKYLYSLGESSRKISPVSASGTPGKLPVKGD